MDAGVTFLLEKVTEVILYYGDLIGGAESELKQLEKDLESLKSFLVESTHKTQKGPILKQLEKEMRELVYEVEDTLDTCLTDANAAAAKAKKKRAAFSIRKLTTKTISLAEKVKSLRQENVKAMLDKATTILTGGGSFSGGGEEPGTLVTKDQSIRQDKVVGFEDEEEKINGYLTDQTKKLDVISIVGLPGQGKTTLTWKIFNSEKIELQFRIRIWLNVSQKMNKKDLFLTILRKFTGGDMSKLSDHELEQEVRGHLENETFLIVLDDVWTVDDWNSIKKALPMDNWKGKIIITSRVREVGMAASLRGPHELRFLTPKESWILLQLEVFEDVGVCPKYLKDIGEQVADNCDGLPLTIVVIGGILVAQYTRQRPPGEIKKDWVKVSEDVTHFIRTDKGDHISKVVGLSYDILPDELRECFLYMGVFPEDYEIPAWILTRLWIAEGFIQKKEKQSLEETAELYLNDLINRNLVMVGRINPMGENKTCRVHDVIRAFCTSKAEDQNLFQEIKKSKEGVLEPTAAEIQKYHRLCIHSELTMFLSQIQNSPTIRSFLCFYKDPVDLHPQYNTTIPDAFKRLRVLDSKSIKLDQFPPTLINVMHLRYVTLYVNQLKIIPEPLAQLWNLQTLVVETSLDTLTMNANLWMMVRLRHLKTKAAIVLQDEKWEGKAGENLQTLGNLSPKSFTESVSKRIRNIKKLGILGNLATEFDTKFLVNLCRLERLKLVNDKYYELANRDKMFCLPRWNGFPRSLKRLTLRKTSLDWSDMSKLAEIESLEVLKLKENAFTGTTWKAVGHGFPCLQFLLIDNTNLVNWEASADHFPVLTCLSLNKCEKLKKIPMELAANLLRLDISFLCPSATESAKIILEQNLKDQENQKLRYGVRFQLNLGPGCA